MEITEVRFKNIDKPSGRLRAYVTVTFNNVFVVHNIKIIEGVEGYFVAMPSHKLKNGGYKDIVHPITTDFRGLLQEQILKKYQEQEVKAGDSSFLV